MKPGVPPALLPVLYARQRLLGGWENLSGRLSPGLDPADRERARRLEKLVRGLTAFGGERNLRARRNYRACESFLFSRLEEIARQSGPELCHSFRDTWLVDPPPGSSAEDQPVEVCNMGLVFRAQTGPADGEAEKKTHWLRGRKNETAPVLVIGAHYDTVPGSPGADDNASAVAVLLELARELAEAPARPAPEIHLVCFTLEEMPWFMTRDMGSYRYASKLVAEKRDVSLMLSLEMLGYFGNHLRQNYPGSREAFLEQGFPETGNFLALVTTPSETNEKARRFAARWKELARFPAHILVGDSQSVRGIDFSDHAPFWELGFPALMLTDTAFYRNPFYHTRWDLPETLNYPAMAAISRDLGRVVRARVL